MTGFGSAAIDNESVRAAVSVRSLNHRYLEVVLQAPRGLAPVEPEIRSRVERRLRRGRVEVAVSATLRGSEAPAVVVDRALVAGVVRALVEIQESHGLSGDVSVSDVARFPGAVVLAEPDLAGASREPVLALLDRALDGLDAMRRQEGERLAAELRRLLERVLELTRGIEALTEQGKAGRREELARRIRELPAELALDETRLLAEVARLVERNDVVEELARLRSHEQQARGLLDEGGATGRRLDFLAQEMAREANTIGSKAASAGVVHAVVELKAEIERFREQVQNVE